MHIIRLPRAVPAAAPTEPPFVPIEKLDPKLALVHRIGPRLRLSSCEPRPQPRFLCFERGARVRLELFSSANR